MNSSRILPFSLFELRPESAGEAPQHLRSRLRSATIAHSSPANSSVTVLVRQCAERSSRRWSLVVTLPVYAGLRNEFGYDPLVFAHRVTDRTVEVALNHHGGGEIFHESGVQ